jgi:type I restriction enzyme, S subunit
MIFNDSKYNKNWEVKKLDDLGSFGRGKSQHRPRDDAKLFLNGKYPLIQTGNVTNSNLYLSKHKFCYNDFGLRQSKLWDKGTLCITIAANIAETAILSYPMCFPDSVVGFSAYPKKTSEIFMHYVFTFIKKSLQESIVGSSIQDNINLEYLQSIEFRIPPIPIQDKINKILHSIDKKIENINKVNNELENIAKTIYNYWFIQFNFPNQKKKLVNLKWNNKLQRKIPDDWKVQNLKNNDLSKTITSGIDNFDNKKNYLTTSDVKNNKINHFPKKINFKNRDSRANMQPIANSVWFAKMKDSKKILLFADYSENYLDSFILSTGFAGLHCKKNSIYYIWNFINDINFEETKNNKSLGATQEAINNDGISYIDLLIPPDYILDMFYSQTNLIYQKIYKNQLMLHEYVKLRDWLLSLLMLGQVKIN